MQCHSGGGEKWLFGGTVFQTDGTTPAPHVQVGVKDSGGLYTTYSGSNGNFWVRDTGQNVDWANADVRIRNANGEAKMQSAPSAACNTCHSGGMVIKEP